MRRNLLFHKMAVEIPSRGHGVAAPPVCVPIFTHIRWRLRMIARSLVAACLLCCSLRRTAHAETGIASVYAYDGGKTASGERANPRRADRRASHAAVRHARVKVTNKRNGRTVCRPHQRSRPVQARPHHRSDAGRGAAARLRRACAPSPSARCNPTKRAISAAGPARRHACSPAGRSARNPGPCAYAP